MVLVGGQQGRIECRGVAGVLDSSALVPGPWGSADAAGVDSGQVANIEGTRLPLTREKAEANELDENEINQGGASPSLNCCLCTTLEDLLPS
jgi:hypothetical protein